MAEPGDSSLAFFTKASPAQWAYVLSLYKDVLKMKAAQRTKKGGPEELIKLDTWYQEELPGLIGSRKDPHISHEELVQITKWKLMRGKFRPRLIDLVRINTELAVVQTTKKAFRKLPNLSNAITALTNLKGVGPATASAILAAGFPEHAPYMADESMLSTPGVEAIDYTLTEYMNYSEQIKARCERLKELDPEGKWNPHKIELTLWTHYLARELKPALLDNLPRTTTPATSSTPNGKSESHPDTEKDESQNSVAQSEGKEEGSEEDKGSDSADAIASGKSGNASNSEDAEKNSDRNDNNDVDEDDDQDEEEDDEGSDEPESKKPRL